MRRIIALFLIFFILTGLAGCEPLRKKFTRKKKEPVKMPRIYQVKKYEKKPTPELYKQHYVYWMTWHSELLKVLGRNHKKDVKCMEEIVGNLKDMQNMLLEEKADQLEPHIQRLVKVQDIITKEDLSTGNKDYVRMTLEREDRFVKREFHYKKVKDHLKKSFGDEDAAGAAPQTGK